MAVKDALKSHRGIAQLSGATVVSLLTVGLLFSTVQRWRAEGAIREGIAAYATGDGDAKALLEEAERARPDDPLPTLYLAQFFLEKGTRAVADASAKKDPEREEALTRARATLAASVRAFDLAQKKRAAWGSDSDTAVVGGCVASAALADAAPAERAAHLDEAKKILEGARAQDDVEVLLAGAGLALARGETDAARKTLDDVSPRLSGAGRGALGSYYWNRGLLALLGREPAGLDLLVRASIFHPGSETARMIALAGRLACADPAVAPKDPDALAARCELVERLATQRLRSAPSRFGLEPVDQGAMLNAAGMGYLQAQRFEPATKAFMAAANADQSEVLYRVNRALSVRLRGEHPPADENPDKWRAARNAEAAGLLRSAVVPLLHKKEREPYAQDLLVLSAGLYYLAANPIEGVSSIAEAHDHFSLDAKDYNRHLGALNDWARRLDLAVPYYKEAVKLGHKDASRMEQRIEYFERRRK